MAKATYEKRFSDQFKDNPKEFLQLIELKLQTKETIKKPIIDGLVIISDDLKIVFAQSSSTTVYQLSSHCKFPWATPMRPSLKSINEYKAPGPDKIYPR